MHRDPPKGVNFQCSNPRSVFCGVKKTHKFHIWLEDSGSPCVQTPTFKAEHGSIINPITGEEAQKSAAFVSMDIWWTAGCEPEKSNRLRLIAFLEKTNSHWNDVDIYFCDSPDLAMLCVHVLRVPCSRSFVTDLFAGFHQKVHECILLIICKQKK